MILWLTVSNMATFKVTDQSLTQMQANQIPTTVIDKLASIKDQSVRGKGDFTNKIEDAIGEQQTDQYKNVIMKSCNTYTLLPFALNSSIHPFVINVFGNLTVLIRWSFSQFLVACSFR